MSVRSAQKLRNTLIIVGILIMFGGYVFDPLLGIGAIMAFSGLIPDFLYNKCPHCGKRLGRNEGDYCQFCGGAYCLRSRRNK